jgi:hypothetical protein
VETRKVVAKPDSASSGAGHGGPARGYSWPPFERGNISARTHGAYGSELRLSEDERTSLLVGEIWETQPVAHAADAGAVWRLALVYRRLELSAAALDSADAEFAGKPLAAYREGVEFLDRLRADHSRWLREAGRIEAELARTPASRAKLGLHLALGERAATLTELHHQAAIENAETTTKEVTP